MTYAMELMRQHIHCSLATIDVHSIQLLLLFFFLLHCLQADQSDNQLDFFTWLTPQKAVGV